MGSSLTKEQLVAKAIENEDLDAAKDLIEELTPEEMRIMCKSLVPGDENQCTILHYAAWQDKPELLALFLEYADDLEIRDALNWTPLSTAVNCNSQENVKMLLNRGAKIDCDSVQGADLIATAMSSNNIELIQILMDHGAQVTIPSNLQTTDENSNNCHLLHFAADDGLTDIARLLIEKGKIPINTLDQSGWSPLHLAAGHNHLDIVKLLLENGAQVNIKDQDGNTPFAWARETNSKEVIDELERHGGLADEEWHGEKLEFRKPGESVEEDQGLQGIDNSEFEIDNSVDTHSTTPNTLQS